MCVSGSSSFMYGTWPWGIRLQVINIKCIPFIYRFSTSIQRSLSNQTGYIVRVDERRRIKNCSSQRYGTKGVWAKKEQRVITSKEILYRVNLPLSIPLSKWLLQESLLVSTKVTSSLVVSSRPSPLTRLVYVFKRMDGWMDGTCQWGAGPKRKKSIDNNISNYHYHNSLSLQRLQAHLRHEGAHWTQPHWLKSIHPFFFLYTQIKANFLHV